MTDIVLTDLDNTILDFDKAEHEAILLTLKGLPGESGIRTGGFSGAGIRSIEAMAERYSVINLCQWKKLEQGLIDRTEVKNGRFRILFEEYGIDYPEEKAAAVYEAHLGEGYFTIPGAFGTLDGLRKDGRHIYLVTNGTAAVQRSRIKGSGLQKYLDDVFISEEIGINKPDAAYFEECFKRIPGFDRKRAVMVGDSLSSDIKGGINAGLTTVWLNMRPSANRDFCFNGTVPDYEINDITELPALLRKLDGAKRP